ncbi:KIF-binding protein-like isoform X2 [Odontomachus brunneus]|uniref:KIF-binding protein-like isoform X2 n=1 Tax=Odontomachus brunneus TaxID=486640 RepID=UPI0013F1E308|nr:KIF-binding protein-like isoform X2 [Odontomachus brunneus]
MKMTSTKVTSKPESKTELRESSSSYESIKPSDEFLYIFNQSWTYRTNRNIFSKKQAEIMNMTMDKLFNIIIDSRKPKLNDTIILAYSYQNMCHAHVQSDEEEELYIAKDFILRCVRLIKDKEMNSKYILIALKAYNHLGYIYYKQNKIDQAIKIYDKAVELYLSYTQAIEEYGIPVDFENLIKPSENLNGHEKLKNVYIFILESLIDIHTETVPKNDHNLMICRHLLLVAEFKRLPQTTNYLKWIEKASILCECLLKYNRFIEAENHLIIMWYVKKIYIDKKYKEIKDRRQEYSLEISKLNKESNIAMYYISEYTVRYLLALMHLSAQRLLRLEKVTDSESDNLPSNSKGRTMPNLLLFHKTELENPIRNNDKLMTIPYITDYNTAYKNFTIVLKCAYNWLSYVKSTMDIKKFTQFTLNISNAYKYMALYEQDTASQILLQNQRIDILSSAIQVISLEHLSMLKYLWLQLAFTYSTVINIKFEHLETIHPLYMPQKHNTIMLEINNLLKNALINLNMYMQHTPCTTRV